jgi:hypothetical protein
MPGELNRGCGELPRGFRSPATALRFLQTSQTEFPLVMSRVNRDIRPCAILHRVEFPGLRCLEQVSGTCARKEGLRILTSPRREASLFKLGRCLRVPANFFCEIASGVPARSQYALFCEVSGASTLRHERLRSSEGATGGLARPRANDNPQVPVQMSLGGIVADLPAVRRVTKANMLNRVRRQA